MKGTFLRVAALAAACTMLMPAAGCGDKKKGSSSSSGLTISDADMPFGAKMTEHLVEDGYEITTYVDYRYITDEESKKIAEYIAAISRKDGALMEKALYPAGLAYVMNAAGSATSAEYAEYLHNSLLEVTEGEFEFDYIQAEEYADENTVDFSKYDDIVLKADPDAEITDRKKIGLDVLFNGGRGSIHYRMGGYIYIYLYTINGTPYVLS
ncbi:MAG: hypothetical protein IKO47_02285 [Ruminococcus sp.]|nr:hypothetical protein [Ruminococcus sp.]